MVIERKRRKKYNCMQNGSRQYFSLKNYRNLTRHELSIEDRQFMYYYVRVFHIRFLIFFLFSTI